ncbi:hypothetical protein SDC9_173609 [bioreactor metagenome]|uniref:Uncharacterized protein n=1 Tax=bioreactor metagenome TaxID=1076179 RepID=A0A645GHL3_9ZZZZ
MPDLAINGGHVKAELSQVFRLELAAFQFDHDVAAQLEVIEQQVDEEFLAADVQQHLPADEGKAGAQFEQEVGDVLHQGVFDVALVGCLGQAEEIETVGVFQRLAGEVGLRSGQGVGKIRDQIAAALQ